MTVRAAALPSQLDALTGIRGIAAWMVVLYHIRLSLTGLLPQGVIAVLAKGYLAVDLFFMLSGFVLWYNYADRLRGGGLAAASEFLWRRFARIWPLHALILLGFVVLASALRLTSRNAVAYPIDQLPLHVLLIQNWGMTSSLTWNDPAWSISTETAAYFAFPLMVSVAARRRLAVVELLGIAAVLLSALYLLFSASGHSTLGIEIPRLGLWRCLLEFTLGTVLCMLWNSWREAPFAAPKAALACSVSLGMGWIFALPEIAFVPFAFACGLLALALDRSTIARALGCRLLVYLGEISFSTYLVHFGLFIVFKLLFVHGAVQLSGAQLGKFLLQVLLVSMALFRFVEKPAQRWLNSHAPRRMRSPEAVAAG